MSTNTLKVPDYLLCIKTNEDKIPTPADIFGEVASDLESCGYKQIPQTLIADYALVKYDLLLLHHMTKDGIVNQSEIMKPLMEMMSLAWMAIKAAM